MWSRGLSLSESLIHRVSQASERRVAKHTLGLGSITAVQVLGGLAQVALSARILGPEGYGILAVIIASTSLIFGLLTVSGGEAVITFVTRSTARGRQDEASGILRFALSVSVGLSLIAYTLIIVLAFVASSLLGIDTPYINVMLLYGLAGVLLSTQTETFAVLRLADRVSLGLAVTLAGMLAQIAMLVGAWLTDGGLVMVVLALVAGAGVRGVGMFLAAAASMRQAGMPDFLQSLSVKVPRDVVMFQFGTFWKNTIGALIQHMDSLLVVQLAGVADAGLYRAARGIIDTARRPFQPLTVGVHAEVSRKWFSSQGAALCRMLLRFSLLSFTVATVGFGILTTFHEFITVLILGPEFLGSAPLVLIMIVGSFVATSMSVLSILPEATGRVRPSLIAHTVAFVAFLTAILWLVPLYGAAGAAWANTTFLLVWCVVILPFVASILRQSYQMAVGSAMAQARSAKEFYLRPQTYEQYGTKFLRGRNLLDDYIETELIRFVFEQYLDKGQNILEIGAYTGRITRKLAAYSDCITVSDTSPEILKKFPYPKMVLDLTTNPNEIMNKQGFDVIISIGHQVSFAGDIANAISVFDELLNPDGALIFDIWNETHPRKYDPPYPIQKSTRKGVQDILSQKGYELRAYRSGCRLPFVFPRVFFVLFSRSNNRVLFNLLLRLEKLTFRMGLFKGREQTQYFIATRSKCPSQRVPPDWVRE